MITIKREAEPLVDHQTSIIFQETQINQDQTHDLKQFSVITAAITNVELNEHISINTRCYLFVVSMFFRRYGRHINVETTLRANLLMLI